MIRNYLKTALRAMNKNRGFTAITVLGFALGLAVCMLIVLYIADDLSYDQYNSKASRIYRINEDVKVGNNRLQYAVCMAALAQTLKKDFPNVENAVRLKNTFGIRLKKGQQVVREGRVLFADASVFDVFTLPMITRNPKDALKGPNSVVLSESAAIKYFGNTHVLGKELLTAEEPAHAYKVTGVIKDIPRKSHFQADFLISMSTYPDSYSTSWLQSQYNTYVLMRKGADVRKLEAALPQFLQKYSGSELQSSMHVNYSQWEKVGSFFRLNLMPLTAIHLHSHLSGELGNNGSLQQLYILSTIALFVLLIACVNFMNLSTARSSGRAMEVGVRKVLGSTQKHLALQFLVESIVLTFLASIVALIFVLLTAPFFIQLSGKELSIHAFDLLWLAPTTVLFVLLVGIFAGSYPAFFLSGFKPIAVLKGNIHKGSGGSTVRNALVVFQFSMSIILIVGSLVMRDQLSYIQKRDLGYDRNQVLVINNAYELGRQAQTLKNQILSLPGIVRATKTSFMPTPLSNRGTAIFYKQAVEDSKNSIFPQTWAVDADYIPTLGMKPVLGRNFSAQMPSDSSGVILNEAAVAFLGMKNPIGKILYKHEGDGKSLLPYHILGVLKNFNFSSLKEAITPLVLTLKEDNGALGIRLKTTNIQSTLNQIENKWKELSSVPIQYSFLDADFDAAYRQDRQMGQICLVFTLLAILISCIGLFGLSAYEAQRRSKEISIRQVLGASISSIVAMLSGYFIRLILLAILLASPLAWLIMKEWLQGFAYHRDIQWWTFLVAALAAIIIALLTTAGQAIKAAVSNPIEHIRNE